MTFSINWSALINAFNKASKDIKQNNPPKTIISTGNLAAALTELNAKLPAIIAAIQAHQGIITGADDILTALEKSGVPYVDVLEAGIDGAPSALSEVGTWLPWILPFLSTTPVQPISTTAGTFANNRQQSFGR